MEAPRSRLRDASFNCVPELADCEWQILLHTDQRQRVVLYEQAGLALPRSSGSRWEELIVDGSSLTT